MISGRSKGQSELRGGRAHLQSACWSIHLNKVDLEDTDKVGLDLAGSKNNKGTEVGKSKVAWRIIKMG